jgi:opacity protein-like surface antigen
MENFKTLIIAASLLSISSLAQATDSNFVGLSYGKTSDNISKSSALNSNLGRPDADAVIAREGTWGIRAGQQNDIGRYYATYDYTSGSRDGIKLRQQNLLGSYDLFVPVAQQTKLFGGVSGGITRLTQKSAGFSRDSDTGYAVGFQGGVLQQVAQNTQVEAGYRYLRSNAGTEMSSNGSKQGSLSLKSAGQLYVSANYGF